MIYKKWIKSFGVAFFVHSTGFLNVYQKKKKKNWFLEWIMFLQKSHLCHLSLLSVSRGCETSRFIRKQLLEEQEQAFELERRRLAELQLVRKPMPNPPYFGSYMDGLKISEGLQPFWMLIWIVCIHFSCFLFLYPFFSFNMFLVLNADRLNFPSAERIDYLIGVLNNGSTTSDRVKHVETNYTDQERYGSN